MLDPRGVWFEVEAEKTHFRDRSLKARAVISVLREVASSEPEPWGRWHNIFYRMGTQSKREWWGLLHWPIIFWHKGLSKEVNVGGWAFCGSPGFSSCSRSGRLLGSDPEFRAIREQRSEQKLHVVSLSHGRQYIHNMCLSLANVHHFLWHSLLVNRQTWSIWRSSIGAGSGTWEHGFSLALPARWNLFLRWLDSANCLLTGGMGDRYDQSTLYPCMKISKNKFKKYIKQGLSSLTIHWTLTLTKELNSVINC